MSLATACFSIYSLISNLSKWIFKAFASSFANSVLPTPLLPVNKNTPIGLFGSFNPAYDVIKASFKLFIARSCPNIFWFNIVDRFFKIWVLSELVWIFEILAILETISLILAFVTLFLFSIFADAPASSMISIALSGRNLSVRYRLAISILWLKISSLYLTLWNFS